MAGFGQAVPPASRADGTAAVHPCTSSLPCISFVDANEVSNLFIDNEDAFNITGNFYDDITASDMHISVSLVSGVTSALSKEEWKTDNHFVVYLDDHFIYLDAIHRNDS